MSTRWRGLAGRVIGAVFFGAIGLFLGLVVVVIWQSPADHTSWLSAVSVKLFFVLLVGSLAGYCFQLALGGVLRAPRPVPAVLAGLCPCCGRLGDGASMAPCVRCGLARPSTTPWRESHPGTRLDDLLLSGMVSSVGFLGLFMLVQIGEGEARGLRLVLHLVLGLLLGAFGLFGPVHLVEQERQRRRARGRYHAELVYSSGSDVERGQATAQLDRHAGLVSAEGISLWRQRPAPADLTTLDQAAVDVLRALVRLEAASLLCVSETRSIIWSRRSALPRIERFAYRDRTGDEAWTCEEHRRPRLDLFSPADEENYPTRPDGWTAADTSRIARLSEVLSVETGRQVSLDEVIDRLVGDASRRAALLAIVDEMDAPDDLDGEPPSDRDVRQVRERRASQLAAWLVG